MALIQRMKIKELKNSAHTASRGRRSFFMISAAAAAVAVAVRSFIFESSGGSSMSAPIPLLPHNRK